MSQRSWKQFDYRYGLVASASQLEVFKTCKRKWWMEKCLKLPQPPFQAGGTGDALHALCEDYLKGDDDPTTKTEWRSTLTASEVDTVAKAFRAMVDAGVLVRRPELHVEKAIQVDVLPDRQASLIGFLDACAPGRVEDHKTTKDAKWLSTEDDLKRDLAMLIYAYAVRADCPEIVLRHNQVVLNPMIPDPRGVETTVTREEAERHWREVVQPMVKQMLELKLSKTPPEEWKKVPGLDDEKQCRRQYGKKCPQYDICHGGKSVAEHRRLQESPL